MYTNFEMFCPLRIEEGIDETGVGGGEGVQAYIFMQLSSALYSTSRDMPTSTAPHF